MALIILKHTFADYLASGYVKQLIKKYDMSPITAVLWLILMICKYYNINDSFETKKGYKSNKSNPSFIVRLKYNNDKFIVVVGKEKHDASKNIETTWRIKVGHKYDDFDEKLGIDFFVGIVECSDEKHHYDLLLEKETLDHVVMNRYCKLKISTTCNGQHMEYQPFPINSKYRKGNILGKGDIIEIRLRSYKKTARVVIQKYFFSDSELIKNKYSSGGGASLGTRKSYSIFIAFKDPKTAANLFCFHQDNISCRYH